jgi:hypothetical protein
MKKQKNNEDKKSNSPQQKPKKHTNKGSQTIQKPRQPEPHNAKNKIRESEGSQRKNMTGNATKKR